jgi:hypothetical protein
MAVVREKNPSPQCLGWYVFGHDYASREWHSAAETSERTGYLKPFISYFSVNSYLLWPSILCSTLFSNVPKLVLPSICGTKRLTFRTQFTSKWSCTLWIDVQCWSYLHYCCTMTLALSTSSSTSLYWPVLLLLVSAGWDMSCVHHIRKSSLKLWNCRNE